MEELFLLHYNRLVDSFESIKPPSPPEKYVFLNYVILPEAKSQRKKRIKIIDGVKYERTLDEKDEMAKECNIDPRFFAQIKENVFPLYLNDCT